MRWLSLAATCLMTSSLVAQTPKLPDAPEGSQVLKDVSYGPHARNKLDLSVPKSDKPLPLVIWVHGGGWEAGDKALNPAALLMAKGYATASINYRYSKQAVFPAQLHDCKAAVRFLRDNAKKYNLDPDAFGVWGRRPAGTSSRCSAPPATCRTSKVTPRPRPRARSRRSATGSARPTSSRSRRCRPR